jgi:hypothetical protein
MTEFYTYLHRCNDDGQVFYIGKGKQRRAWAASKRSQHWNNVVAKHGHTVEILAKWKTEAEAFEHEMFLIACFRDLGAPLVNRTDGGEGASGYVHTPKTRAQMSVSAKGHAVSIERRAKIRAFMTGRTLSAEHREKVRQSKLGHVVSAETRAKLSASINKPETIEKLRASGVRVATNGRKFSSEHRAKLSASMTAHYARKRQGDNT